MSSTLRWVAILPGAILAALFALVPLHLVLYQTLTGSGLVEPYPEAPERILGPLVSTLAFVWIGSRIAPSRKVATAVILFGALLIILGAIIALGLAGARVGNSQFYLQMGGLPPVSGIVGAFLGIFIANYESNKSVSLIDEA